MCLYDALIEHSYMRQEPTDLGLPKRICLSGNQQHLDLASCCQSEHLRDQHVDTVHDRQMYLQMYLTQQNMSHMLAKLQSIGLFFCEGCQIGKQACCEQHLQHTQQDALLANRLSITRVSQVTQVNNKLI